MSHVLVCGAGVVWFDDVQDLTFDRRGERIFLRVLIFFEDVAAGDQLRIGDRRIELLDVDPLAAALDPLHEKIDARVVWSS
ncbi:MAG: hypothetical protein R3F11_27610 [Verrucomicrobiales bacterium]